MDQRDRIVLGSTLGPEKYILSWKSSTNKSMIRIGVVFRADSEFANKNSRGAHLGPVLMIFDSEFFATSSDVFLIFGTEGGG